MVYVENCSAITEFLLTGFNSFQGFRIPMFVLFLAIFLFIFLENLLIIYIIHGSSCLKAPMFFIIECICLCDLLEITNVIPKFLNDILHEKPTITVAGCIAQLQLYGTKGDTYTFLYALMSYDRYLAVCHPLRYSSFVNKRMYLHCFIIFVLISAACIGVISGLQSQLQFCGHNTIHHFFCDTYPLMDLATSDTTHIRILIVVLSALVILVTVLSVFITYGYIIRVLLKIPSTSGRRKTFSTCSSHLIVFSMQYGLTFGVYVLPAKVVTPHFPKTFTFLYFFWTPLVNPLIYSFNNKEFRAECMRKISKVSIQFRNPLTNRQVRLVQK